MEELSAERVYAHRAKPIAPPMVLRLSDELIIGERGSRKEPILLSKLARIRLRYAPRNTALHAFRCEARAIDGRGVVFDNISWTSLMQNERLDADYRAFVLDLVTRAAKANPKLQLEAGVGRFHYRLMQISGIAILVGLIATGVAAAIGKSLPLAGLAAALVIYLGYWLREFLTRNKPRSFEASAVPEGVLPTPESA